MDFNSLLQQSAGHAWLYLPVAVLLGALHGLEPGHSKTMMAAFIIAVRGTVVQAALLGLSAALSHSAVIWVLAALALKFGSQWNVETAEPYFLMATGVIVVAMAAWTLWRLRGGGSHAHHHHHDESPVILETPGGAAELTVFEDGVPPRFRISNAAVGLCPIRLRTVRASGESQEFSFLDRDGYWESAEEIPEPHAFRAEVEFETANGLARSSATFEEHDHDHGDEDGDAHAREHAEQIRRRFTGRAVTTPQIILFGLTGGLMPCPAALSILLICLQLKRFTLGFSLVAGFSLGLAITLVTVGVVAAWGIKQVTRNSGFLGRIADKAPYLSSGVLILLGVVFFIRGAYLVA